MTREAVELKEHIEAQPASSEYTDIGKYNRSGYSLFYSPSMTRTRKNRYDSEGLISEDNRISFASDELAIQLGLERAGIDPRDAEVFNDLFARKNSGWYAFQWTGTDLRVPKGRSADKYETDSQGRKYWPRIAVVGGQEIGEVLVPEGNGRVVVEWDEVFGIPKATSDSEGDMKYDNHTTHFYFNISPEKNPRTDEYDVNVARRSFWRHDGRDRCLSVGMGCEPWHALGRGGVRQVRGSLPEIKAEF